MRLGLHWYGGMHCRGVSVLLNECIQALNFGGPAYCKALRLSFKLHAIKYAPKLQGRLRRNGVQKNLAERGVAPPMKGHVREVYNRTQSQHLGHGMSWRKARRRYLRNHKESGGATPQSLTLSRSPEADPSRRRHCLKAPSQRRTWWCGQPSATRRPGGSGIKSVAAAFTCSPVLTLTDATKSDERFTRQRSSWVRLQLRLAGRSVLCTARSPLEDVLQSLLTSGF